MFKPLNNPTISLKFSKNELTRRFSKACKWNVDEDKSFELWQLMERGRSGVSGRIRNTKQKKDLLNIPPYHSFTSFYLHSKVKKRVGKKRMPNETMKDGENERRYYILKIRGGKAIITIFAKTSKGTLLPFFSR